MSFDALRGGRSFPIDHAGGGGGGGIPWTGGWGSSALATLTLGFLRADAWGGAATVSNTLTARVFPSVGGQLDILSIRFQGGIAAAQDTTWTVLADGVATGLTFVIPAGSIVGEIRTPVIIAPSATPIDIEVQFTAPANPGAGATVPQAFVAGFVNAA